ncbi:MULTISPECIES: DNA internalization-related competence protein ComEC/Rec2 [unclassified Methylophaga]|uniref:DNA internalization-related competence protein ComEC/Rec2 n=1 Tax=unclassified Methylophaga TaxID=2629249 RepID=UPI000C8A3F48|nr:MULTISPECIES: DNA internalization-related competence protein ComEC/Rec2 [unclassified Methylophaga]MBN45985.1 DNA internalization-related competence protein ComEC/Rec2 [Methylophaga sp.]|tara:strand:- start:24792 stop:27059 length:2268 start_codon:yes stop_codon:yes gene_type:complete
MIKPAIAFLSGCLLVAWLPQLPSLYWLLTLFPLIVIAWRWSQWTILWFIVALLWTGIQTHIRLDNQLDATLERQDILVSGFITSLPHHNVQHVRFEFKPENSSVKLPAKLRLSWYFPPDITPQANEKWQLLVRLKMPQGMANPGGFDYESWLFQQQIGATGYIRQSELNKKLQSAPMYSVNYWRATLIEKMTSLMEHSSHLALIQGLGVGSRDLMQPEQWETLRKTGTSHLLAISGLHIGLAAALGFFAVKTVWRMRSRHLLILSDRQAGAMGGFLLAVFYALLAGLSIPTQRALVMVSVVMLSIFIKRRVEPLQVLSLSLILVLFIDPFAVLAVGFWLSFAAVICILYVAQYRQPARKWLWLHIHFWIAAGLTPLLLLFFQETSLIAPLANLLAVPLVSFLIVPLLLLTLLLLSFDVQIAAWLLHLTERLLSLLWWYLDWLAQLPISVWQTPVFSIGLLSLSVIGILILLAPRGWPLRWLGLILILPLFWYSPKRPDAAEIWFTLLDVGQGLSAVVQTQNHTLVFDTGPTFGDFDTGSAVVVPYLRHLGVKNLDTLVISHADNDHIGGAHAVLSNYPARQILSSDPDKLTDSALCQQGQSWQWDEVLFEVLHPSNNDSGSRNDLSCVLKISSQYGSILLTGDIERRSESGLVRQYARQLNADILIAPHHGSRSSSSLAFIQQVSPRFVLFASGYQNRYNFPAADVVARYHEMGSKTYQTGRLGALFIKLDRKMNLMPTGWREQHRRLWMRNATE